MGKSIFISHASPEDNDFARWLSLQLVGLGYEVWCDVIKLRGGEDWWSVIENEIRNNSVKFLVILSQSSNYKEGVLKEIAVAEKVKKNSNDKQFIVPLHLDPALSYDDINLELLRINSINFKSSWADGLKNLLLLFEEHSVPKSNNEHENVSEIWQNIYLRDKRPLFEEEIYSSNWFPVIEIPSVLRFHKINYAIPKDFDFKELSYPGLMFKEYLATFAYCYDFMKELPRTTTYNQVESIEISLPEIIEGTFSSEFIQNREAKKILIVLLNKAFDHAIRHKPVSIYQMSNKVSYWIKKGTLDKDKFNKIQLVGKQLDKIWHFGISGNAKLYPELCIVINSHIWFTNDGENLIQEAGKQHSARRKQGKNWWNNDWRNKILAFMQFLAESDGYIHLEVGSEEKVCISSEPFQFNSPVRYNDPNKNNLPGDDFDYDYDEIETEVSDSLEEPTE